WVKQKYLPDQLKNKFYYQPKLKVNFELAMKNVYDKLFKKK
ncbi:hypothetical protein P9C26_23360, partial [Bacillus paralicheniformis]